MALFQSVELAVPFRIGSDGAVATVSDPNAIERQHVSAVVGTQRGERVMLPDFGVNIQRFLFQTNDPSLNVLMQEEIRNALTVWEPSIKLNTATMVVDDSEGTGHLAISYSTTNTSNPAQTVTLSVSSST